jgi:hypothetical protein
MAEKDKINVLTTKGACEILGIKPAWFHQKYRDRLTRLPSIDNKAYYNYDEVVALKKKKETVKHIYNVIK